MWKLLIDKEKSSGIYKGGQIIFNKNNIVFGIYFIYRGKVKVFDTGRNNKNHIIRLASAGEIIGLRGYAEKNYRVSGSALEDTTLCFIEKSLFFKVLRENPELSINLIHFYAQELTNMEVRQKYYQQLNSMERIAETLLLIKAKYGVTVANGTLLDVNLSRQDIADLGKTSVEETIRTLSKFKKQQFIVENEQNKRIIILNHAKLMEMAAGAN